LGIDQFRGEVVVGRPGPFFARLNHQNHPSFLYAVASFAAR
jgi:hypothetical protein